MKLSRLLVLSQFIALTGGAHPEPVGYYAQQRDKFDTLYWVLSILCWTLGAGVAIYFIRKERKRQKSAESPPPTHPQPGQPPNLAS